MDCWGRGRAAGHAEWAREKVEPVWTGGRKEADRYAKYERKDGRVM